MFDDRPFPPDDDRGVAEAEIEAFYADMAAAPPDLPTEAEVDAMFAALGEKDPF